MKTKLLGCIPVLLCIIVSSCTKDPLNHMTEEESRIYITNYDTTAAFSNYKTFYIADSVAIVSNDRLLGKQLTAYDARFIQAFAAALQQRGYTQVANGQTPDLGIAISQINNTSTGLVEYNSGYYDSYWDPYYLGYPGYSYDFPVYYGTYQINENALTVDMFDLKNGRQNNQLKSLWSGLIRGEGIFREENISTQVQALLNQSSYLKNQ